jgi:hypothetical protein
MDTAINTLKEMLDTPDGIKTIESLMNTFMSGEAENEDEDSTESGKDDEGNLGKGFSDIPVDSIMKIAGAYKSLNKTSDPRITLLKAIKPYVRSSRSESVDTAIRLLGLLRLMPLLGELKDVL